MATKKKDKAQPPQLGTLRLKPNNRKTVSDPATVMASIIRMQATLYKKEISNWLAAREASLNLLNPNHFLLYELYDYIKLDAMVYRQMQNRILRISNKSFNILTAGVVNEEKTAMLRREWFQYLLKLGMESEFERYSLIYFEEIAEEVKKVSLIYRDHVIPEKGIIVKQVHDQEGMSFHEPPISNYCIGVGYTDNNLGLLDKAAPLYILKKHSWANWDEFEEKYGIDIRVAKTSSNDPKVKKEIENWLRTMGSASYGLFPGDTELTILEKKNTDVYQVFNEKINAANKELAILFNGEFETSSDTGSRAKAETVIKSTSGEITKDDEKRMEYLVTDRVLPMLASFGYPFTPEDSFKFDNSEQLSAKDKAAIMTQVDSWGWELDKEQIQTELGIKVTGKKPMAEPAPILPPAEKKKSNLSQQLTKLYTRCCSNEDVNLADLPSSTEAYDAIWERLASGIHAGDIKAGYIDEELFNQISKDLTSAVTEGFGGSPEDFNPGTPDRDLIDRLLTNVNRFSGFKTDIQIQQATKLLVDSKGDLRNFADFKKEILQLNQEYNTNYLRAEYQHAVTSAEMANKWGDIQRDKESLPLLQIRVTHDGRTREEHFKMDRITLPVDNPFWKTKYVPFDWGCRCNIVQLASGEITDLSKIKLPALKPMFENNAGITGKVFNDKHPYAKAADKKAVNKFLENKNKPE